MTFNYTFYCDGATEPTNPGGASGIGCAIYKDDKLIKEYSYYIPKNPKNTNNVAEYMAFIRALKHIKENGLTGKMLIRGDSMLCIKQLSGEWGAKGGMYLRYYLLAKTLTEELSKQCEITFEWIPREKNEVADELSKRELANHGIYPTKR
jgi:ribonuclease HI